MPILAKNTKQFINPLRSYIFAYKGSKSDIYKNEIKNNIHRQPLLETVIHIVLSNRVIFEDLFFSIILEMQFGFFVCWFFVFVFINLEN